MNSPQDSTILIATWEGGLLSITGKMLREELPGQSVRSLVGDGRGGVLAIVGGNSLCRRSAAGEWTTIAKTDFALSCCCVRGDVLFAGTDDARILRISLDGELVGPPLGIRSMAVTRDGTLLANVHVGGIPRSIDGGLTWRPTIDIDCDVHQVCAHPNRPEIVAAAAAAGLCLSRDAGATWTIERRGLHALHCSAVAFGRRDVFVSASTDPFAAQGAVYRRAIDADEPLQRLGGGMPDWTKGKADTGCIATRDAKVAVIDGAGCLYVSDDDGATWSASFDCACAPSALHIC